MKKLIFPGTGSKIAAIALPWMAVTIIVSLLNEPPFYLINGGNGILLYSGSALLAAVPALCFSTVPHLFKGRKATKLITTGGYALC